MNANDRLDMSKVFENILLRLRPNAQIVNTQEERQKKELKGKIIKAFSDIYSESSLIKIDELADLAETLGVKEAANILSKKAGEHKIDSKELAKEIAKSNKIAKLILPLLPSGLDQKSYLLLILIILVLTQTKSCTPSITINNTTTIAIENIKVSSSATNAEKAIILRGLLNLEESQE